jgi:hypothetical protein
MYGILLASLLAGCAPDPAPSTEDTAPDPAPYIFDEADPPVATLEPSDLEGTIDAAVALVLTLNAAPIFPVYSQIMATSEANCPNYYDYEGSQYWYDQCDTNSGTSFSGYSFYQLYDNYDAGDGSIYNGESLYGVARIDTADGYTFEAGGSAYNLVVTADTYTYYASTIAGAFAWNGTGAEGTWLATGVSPDLSLVAYIANGYGSMTQVDGGLSGLGAPLDTVVFDTLTLMSDGLTTCPTEPGGVVSVRDDEGSWYDVVFDGPSEYGDEVDAAACDGCGAAYFRGEYLGQVCADFSALLDWETTPW